MRHWRARRMAAALLGAALLLSGCGGAARDASVTGDAEAGSPSSYRQALATAAEPLRTALAGLAGAKALEALTAQLAQAEQAAARAAEQLDQLTPPPDIRAEHADLVQALRQLDGDLGGLRDAVHGRQLCASTAVMARLGQADGLTAVRAASAALAVRGSPQGYKLDLPALATPRQQSRRLPNGQFVRQASRTGKGELTIDNDSELDTVITLALGRRPALSVYVRNHAKQKVTGIRDGTYQIYYTAGVDWDPRVRAFTRNCTFERFDDAFKFKTTQSATEVVWTTWSVGLKPVAGGNADTSEVAPNDFPAA